MDRLFSKTCGNMSKRNSFKVKGGRFRLDTRKFFFYSGDDEALAQRAGSCPIPEDTQGQVGWDSEQTDLVEDVCDHCREVGLDGLSKSFPTQVDSVI